MDKQTPEMTKAQEERTNVLLQLLEQKGVFHDQMIYKNDKDNQGIFVFTDKEQLLANKDWYTKEKEAQTIHLEFQHLAQMVKFDSKIEVVVVNPFTDMLNISRQFFVERAAVERFFDFEIDQNAGDKLMDWLKSHPVLVFTDKEKPVMLKDEQGTFLIAHTNEASVTHEAVNAEGYLEMDFSALGEYFAQNPAVDTLFLNPSSDGIRIKKEAFVAQKN